MAFRRNDIRRRHEITHSKEYRYFCAICGKGFIRRYVLVKHLLRDHDSTDTRKIVYQKNKKKFDEDILNNMELKEELSSQSISEADIVKKDGMQPSQDLDEVMQSEGMQGEGMQGEGEEQVEATVAINKVEEGGVEECDSEGDTVQIRIEHQQQEGDEPMDDNAADILYVSRAHAESIQVANALLAAAAGEVPARIENDPSAAEDEANQPVKIEVQMIT